MLFKRGETLPENYDIVVIGSGLGGMTAANVLAKGGQKVLLLEAHNKLGGLATWFFRDQKKYIFDVSLHGFPFNMKKTCRRYWSPAIADHIVQLKDIRFANPEFTLQTDYTKSHFKELLTTKFNVAPSVVHQFFAFIEQMNFYDAHQMTNRELFEKFFPGRTDIVRLLMEPITYANGSTLDDPAITYGIVFSNFMGAGIYTFKGGTDHLIKMMKEELLKNGVDIKLGSKVEQIILNHGMQNTARKQVTGVLVDGQKISARAVLSNANLYHTIFSLTGKQYFSETFIAEAQKVRMNSSSCQVYMAIREGEVIPHIGDLIFTSTYPTYDAEKLLNKNITSRTFSVYYPQARPQDEIAKYSIVSSTNAHYDDWKNLSETEYNDAKNSMIEDTLKCLETFIPNIRSKIAFIDAATPLTIEHYTHHYRGSSFGTKFEGLAVSSKLPEEIQGLYHAGSVGIIMSGWLGAANYGVIQANNVENFLQKRMQQHEFEAKH